MKKLLLTLFALGLSAHADIINITLSNASQTGSPGDTLQYFGVLTNTTSDTVFLNSASSTSVSGDLKIDTSPFFVNTSGSLGPNESTALIELFDIIIGVGAVDGPYIGNIFSIQGGADDFTFGPLGDATADVIVAPSTAPEPSSFVLLAAALVGMACCRKGRGVRQRN